MEELYGLLNDRLISLREMNEKFKEAISLAENNFIHSSGEIEIQKLSEYLHQLKKAEKMRVIKENNYLEVIYCLKAYDEEQLMYTNSIPLAIS